ncbi:DUF6197 family protein [Mycobacterium intracellulare]|uniref:DUF6197 family protein n=1 Tax=Mycobacterium intracellulare TaxID=1767 RepID=UPI0019253199|nr:hypothetical protein [Mycobacterium intracellulare]BCP29573.1 hypothetical protein MINTM026_05430 [Mycobacterium intracellulare]
MKNLLYVAPALVPPDPVEIIEALEDARTLVGPHLPKGNAVEIMGNWGCLCIVAAITAAAAGQRARGDGRRMTGRDDADQTIGELLAEILGGREDDA